MLKALAFNRLKPPCFQAFGFKRQPAPLHDGFCDRAFHQNCCTPPVRAEDIPEVGRVQVLPRGFIDSQNRSIRRHGESVDEL